MSPDPPQPPPADGPARRANVARSALVVLAIAVLALLPWQLAGVFLLVFGGILLATALRALAAPLERRAGLSSRWALAIATTGVAAVLAIAAWLIGDRLAAQLGEVRQRLPEALAALSGWLNDRPLGVAILDSWENAKAGDVPWARIASVATLTFGAIGSALLVVVIGIFLAADPELYRKGLVRLVPIDYRKRVDEALVASGLALERWLLGQGISMLFVGVATAAGLAALGMPLALSLGFIAGLLGFIPFFGPLAAGVLAVLFAFTQGPTQALYVAGLALLIQQVEGNLLMPFVQRWAVSLPPVLGIVAAVAFGLLFGIVGVLFATPLMVVTMVLVEKLYVEGALEARTRGAAPPRPHR